jgi:hypothetical protein
LKSPFVVGGEVGASIIDAGVAGRVLVDEMQKKRWAEY